jgi:hypothetical protein
MAALLFAVLVPQPATAQLATGRSGSSTMSYIGGEEVWREVGFFGLCYAGQNRESALMLIATTPGSMEEAQTYKKLFSKPYLSCLGDVASLRVSHDMIRGAIAEGLLKKAVPIPASMVLQPPPPGTTGKTISEAARCYAAAHPGSVRSLVATSPGSKKEYAAVVALLPDFMECVPAKARNLPLSATQVRFRLAEALLRLPAGKD